MHTETNLFYAIVAFDIVDINELVFVSPSDDNNQGGISITGFPTGRLYASMEEAEAVMKLLQPFHPDKDMFVGTFSYKSLDF